MSKLKEHGGRGLQHPSDLVPGYLPQAPPHFCAMFRGLRVLGAISRKFLLRVQGNSRNNNTTRHDHGP